MIVGILLSQLNESIKAIRLLYSLYQHIVNQNSRDAFKNIIQTLLYSTFRHN